LSIFAGDLGGNVYSVPTCLTNIYVEAKKDFDINNLEASFKSDVDEMLMAYETGWAERGIDDKNKFQARVKVNVDNTVNYTKEVVSYFRKLKLAINGAFIKLERTNSLSVLITVPVETFMNEMLLDVYSFTHDIERHSRSDDYRVSFSVTYNDGDINEDALLSDGFYRIMETANG
jgi:hypothetical protein